jgi:hypothetical protein
VWLSLLLLPACRPVPAPQALAEADAALSETFQELHRPIYQVYELGGDRDAIHALLQGSFAGEALTQEYVEHFTTLHTMAAEETAIEVIRVDYESVTVLERSPSDPGVVRIEADWSVGGVVTHQAHKHTRVNRYVAVYTLEQREQGWRIIDTHMRDLARVRSVLSAYATDDNFLLDAMPSSGGGLMDPLDMLDAGVGQKEEKE